MVRDGARAPPHHEGKTLVSTDWPRSATGHAVTGPRGCFARGGTTLPLQLNCRILFADPLLPGHVGKNTSEIAED